MDKIKIKHHNFNNGEKVLQSAKAIQNGAHQPKMRL